MLYLHIKRCEDADLYTGASKHNWYVCMLYSAWICTCVHMHTLIKTFVLAVIRSILGILKSLATVLMMATAGQVSRYNFSWSLMMTRRKSRHEATVTSHRQTDCKKYPWRHASSCDQWCKKCHAHAWSAIHKKLNLWQTNSTRGVVTNSSRHGEEYLLLVHTVCIWTLKWHSLRMYEWMLCIYMYIYIYIYTHTHARDPSSNMAWAYVDGCLHAWRWVSTCSWSFKRHFLRLYVSTHTKNTDAKPEEVVMM
jgi:hypothetical protein